MGHPQEYIILPSADTTLDLSCGFIIFLTKFSTHAFQTCHKTTKLGHLVKYFFVETTTENNKAT